MSFDLNTRGVKRKLEAIEPLGGGGVELLSIDSSDQRRPKLSSDSVAYNQPLPEIETLANGLVPTATPLITTSPGNDPHLCNATFRPITNSSSSLSSDDDEDDDEEEDEEDEDEDDDDEDEDDLIDDFHGSYANQSTDDSFANRSVESESGYDERASNSSNDSHGSAASDCEYSPPPLLMTSSECTIQTTPLVYSSQPSTSGNILCNSSTNQVQCKSSFHYSQSPYYQTSNHNNRNKANYMRQRQQIFNLSMGKLGKFRQSQDPSLHRSVLICNTLRRLEKEFEREGVKINFGPNGVSFISPVATPDLDFLPIVHSNSANPTSSQSSPTLPMTAECPLPQPSVDNEDAGFDHQSSPMSTGEPTSYQYPMSCDPSLENGSEYEKYFTIDNQPSGRVTPFIKSPYPGNEPYSNRLIEPSSNSFWESTEDPMCDRLSALNWGSMLNFNSTPAPLSPPISLASEVVSDRHPMVSTNVATTTRCSSSIPSIMPYTIPTTSEQLQANAASQGLSSNTLTLLPLTPPSSVSSLESNSAMLVSSTATVSEGYESGSSGTTMCSSYYQSDNANSVTCSSIASDLPTPVSFVSSAMSTNSTSSITVSSSNLISSSYSYLNYANNGDEMFNDIDLSFSTIDIDRYDFDLYSPLSPPNGKSQIMSAEELGRAVNSVAGECNNNNSNSSNVITLSTSTSTTTLLTLNHYSSNSYSGYNSSNYSNGVSPVPSAITSSTSTTPTSVLSSLNGQLAVANCGASSAASSGAGTGLHFSTTSRSYYKPEERDQQKITTIKCHN